MKSKKKIYFIISASCLLLAVILRFALTGMGFTASCFAALAFFFLIFALIGDSNTAKTVKIVMTALLALIILTTILTEIFIFSCTSTEVDDDVDWIIIFGAGLSGTRVSYSLASRLDSALEYLNTNKKCRVVVSGGKGKGEKISEAQAMKDYLLERGVAASRILLEDQSSTTEENVFNSFRLISLSPYYNEDDKVAVVSSAYHLYRISIMAQDTVGEKFGKIGRISASTRKYFVINYYLREAAAVWYYRVIG